MDVMLLGCGLVFLLLLPFVAARSSLGKGVGTYLVIVALSPALSLLAAGCVEQAGGWVGGGGSDAPAWAVTVFLPPAAFAAAGLAVALYGLIRRRGAWPILAGLVGLLVATVDAFLVGVYVAVGTII